MKKFTSILNVGALLLFVAAVVALVLSPKAPPKEGRQLASESVPGAQSSLNPGIQAH